MLHHWPIWLIPLTIVSSRLLFHLILLAFVANLSEVMEEGIAAEAIENVKAMSICQICYKFGHEASFCYHRFKSAYVQLNNFQSSPNFQLSNPQNSYSKIHLGKLSLNLGNRSLGHLPCSSLKLVHGLFLHQSFSLASSSCTNHSQTQYVDFDTNLFIYLFNIVTI